MKSHISGSGWNTWDVRHLNAVVHLPSGLRLHCSLIEPESGRACHEFDWRSGLERLGPHAGDGSYCRLTLRWQQAVIVCTYAADGDHLACRIAPERGCAGLRLALDVDGAWAAGIETTQKQAGIVEADAGGIHWLVQTSGAEPVGSLTFALDQPLLVSVSPVADHFSLSDASDLLDKMQERESAGRLRSEGWLGDAAEGLARAIAWNTIWEPIKGRICTPVSRDWCKKDFFGSYVLFDWDTFFCAMMAVLDDPALATANVRAILQEVTPQGFVPNFGCAFGPSGDRSQPPVGAYCLLKLARSAGLGALSAPWRALLAEAFPALLRWHEWWLPHRDGNHDGLLEWGSDPFSQGKPAWQAHNLQAAMYESGLDNSPMYDGVTFNSGTHTMELADVGLNALYALDAWALAEIATELGLDDSAARLAAEHAEMGRRINDLLWNEQAGIYCNRRWDGAFSPHLSPTLFYPMLAGVVPPERAARLVHEHLLNESEFWGTWVLPSIARNDPGFGDNDYWRGRIWPPMNFLVCEGLRRCGFDAEAHELARRSLRLFLGEWQGESHVHENFNAGSGDGDDSRSSDPMYTWGALLAYIALQELADAEPWESVDHGGHGWRFGNLSSDSAAVHNICLDEGELSVAGGPDGLQVTLNGELIVATDQPAIMRGFRRAAHALAADGTERHAALVEFSLAAEAPDCRVRLGALPAGRRVRVSTSSAGTRDMTVGADGQLEFLCILPAHGACLCRVEPADTWQAS